MAYLQPKQIRECRKYIVGKMSYVVPVEPPAEEKKSNVLGFGVAVEKGVEIYSQPLQVRRVFERVPLYRVYLIIRQLTEK